MMPFKIGSMIKKQVKYKETPNDTTYYEGHFLPATEI